MARPPTRVAQLSPLTRTALNSLFGGVANTMRVLGLKDADLTYASVRRSLAGQPSTLNDVDLIEFFWAKWAKEFLIDPTRTQFGGTEDE